jgi:flagellar hook-basal body complex protein FliE
MSNAITPGLGGFGGTLPTSPTEVGGPGKSGGGFGATLRTAINQVNDLSQDSQEQVTGLLQGDRQDLHNVMIAVEKADIAFQLMMQVRNKIVNAYEEVSKMQF